MDITKYDKNFGNIKSCDAEFDVYSALEAPFTLYGGLSEECRSYERMPASIAKEISDGVYWASGCGAGLRLTFSTNAKKMKLYVKFNEKCMLPRMAVTGSASFNLVCDSLSKNKFIGNFTPDLIIGNKTFEAELNLFDGNAMLDYVLYFPLYSCVEELNLSFEKGSNVSSYKKYDGLKHVLYYGSSITHGGCASRADNFYPQLISEWTNTDYTVLGFSGSAKAEDKMTEYLKEFKCDLFVCDYDHNAPNADYLAATHEKLYKKFKENPAHKNVPVIFLSSPDGLRMENGNERVSIIEKTYLNAKSYGDEVYFIDGRTIYPEDVREHCAVDGCHPTDLGFYFMAKAIYPFVCKALKIR